MATGRISINGKANYDAGYLPTHPLFPASNSLSINIADSHKRWMAETSIPSETRLHTPVHLQRWKQDHFYCSAPCTHLLAPWNISSKGKAWISCVPHLESNAMHHSSIRGNRKGRPLVDGMAKCSSWGMSPKYMHSNKLIMINSTIKKSIIFYIYSYVYIYTNIKMRNGSAL